MIGYVIALTHGVLFCYYLLNPLKRGVQILYNSFGVYVSVIVLVASNFPFSAAPTL